MELVRLRQSEDKPQAALLLSALNGWGKTSQGENFLF